MKPFRILFFGAVVWLFISSCSREKINLVWEERSLPVAADCRDISIADDLHGFAVGGEVWNTGYVAETFDGGSHWQIDSISPWHLYSIANLPQGSSYISGFGGYMNERSASGETWQMHSVPYWIPWNDISYLDDAHGVIAGGQAYKGGRIIRINENHEIVQQDSFPQEISAIAWTTPQTIHAVGYGIILRSSDGGITWDINAAKGDFFRSLSFPSPNTGYIVGSSGSILKTEDGGTHWTKLRNGKSPSKSDLRFRSVFFVNDLKGYIAGENGLFWRTTDGGQEWQQIEGLPDIDFYTVTANEQGGWIGGAGGRIFYFKD